MRGLNGNSATSYSQVAAPAGLRGHVDGFWVAALFTPNDLTNSEQLWRSYASTSGARFFKASTTSLVFQVVAGDGTTTISSPSYTMSAADLGKVTGVVGVYDEAAGLVRLYVNRVEVGSGTAITGHTPASGVPINIVAFTMHTSSVFHGVMGGDGTYPALADIQAWFDSTRGARALGTMPGATTDHRWQVTALSAPVDSVGADNLSFVGTGKALVATTAPQFGWST